MVVIARWCFQGSLGQIDNLLGRGGIGLGFGVLGLKLFEGLQHHVLALFEGDLVVRLGIFVKFSFGVLELLFFAPRLRLEAVDDIDRSLSLAVEVLVFEGVDQSIGDLAAALLGSGCSTLTSTNRLRRMGTMVMSSATARTTSSLLRVALVLVELKLARPPTRSTSGSAGSYIGSADRWIPPGWRRS